RFSRDWSSDVCSSDLQPLAEPEQVVADTALDLQAVLHELEVVVLLAEDVLELGRDRARLLEVADAQPRLHLAAGAARRGDEPLRSEERRVGKEGRSGR